MVRQLLTLTPVTLLGIALLTKPRIHAVICLTVTGLVGWAQITANEILDAIHGARHTQRTTHRGITLDANRHVPTELGIVRLVWVTGHAIITLNTMILTPHHARLGATM